MRITFVLRPVGIGWREGGGGGGRTKCPLLSSLIVSTGREIWTADVPQGVPRLAQTWGLYREHKDWKTC